MKRFTFLTALAFVGISAMSVSKVAYVKDFDSTYGVKKGSTLGTAACAVCHVGKTAKLNVYGKDLQAAMKKEGAKTMTGSVLKKVEGLDSDKDDKTNLVEIKADTLPGDAKSK